jgi:glyoxylase-like metal-dependent hydrolase (beta-lactamase superfamily II)
MTTPATRLRWEVFVAPGIPVVAEDLAPGTDHWDWQPTTATLISGEQDAVLVDALLTIDQGRALADWVAASGKNLTTVYITHGHGDHWFGLAEIRKRFPQARAVARPAVVKHMNEQAGVLVGQIWEPWFPNQIPDDRRVAEAMQGNTVELEDNELHAVDLGHTDSDDTTCLHVPSIGLVVAGDSVYNNVHMYFGESSPAARRSWLAALDTIESLRPSAVVAGHKRDGRGDHSTTIEETRQYIRDFDRVAGSSDTTEDLYQRMLDLHPDRVNPGMLWFSARSTKG